MRTLTRHPVVPICILAIFLGLRSTVFGFLPPLELRTRSLQAGARLRQSSELCSSQINSAVALVTKKSSKNKSIVRGKFKSAIDKIFISPPKLAAVFKATGIHLINDWKEILLISILIHVPVPLARTFFEKHRNLNEKQFARSKTRKVASVLSELGLLSAFMYCVDVSVLVFQKLRFDFVDDYPIGSYAGILVAAFWGAGHLSDLKKYLIRQFLLEGHEFSNSSWEDIVSSNVSGKISNTANGQGKLSSSQASRQSAARVANRVGDVVIVVSLALIVLDLLNIQIGFLLKSVFGLGSLGTLAFSLASKNIVAEFLASLAIKGTNMYRVGEKIWLSDGTIGTVTDVGWLSTHIRRPDELVVRIPNTKLSGALLANISRTTMAQVRQTVAIKYQDIEKLRTLSKAIKEEIKSQAGCRELLVTNGSRPFRVNWREYKDKHLELVVDVHFQVRPNSDAFYDVQEQVLDSIAVACKKLDVQFSYADVKAERDDAPAKKSVD